MYAIMARRAVIMAQARLSPESCLSRKDHLTPTLRAGMMVPRDDATASAVEAQSPGKAIERRSVVADDAAYDKRLDRMAVGTAHAHDMLAHEPRTFIVVTLIAALLAAISLSLCHFLSSFNFTYPFMASITSVATSLAHAASRPTSMRIYSRPGFLVVRTNWYCPVV